MNGLAALLVLAAAAAMAAGCGGEGGATMSTAASIATVTGTVPASYASDIDDITSHADKVNQDYKLQVDRHEAGELGTAELVEFADESAGEFTAMLQTLQEMDVPAGLEDSHRLLISGFGKWQRFYQLQVTGLQSKDPAQLAQARELDNQAVDEVYEAIGDINLAINS
jgi:hypothetical protein